MMNTPSIKLILSEAELQAKVMALGKQISMDYADKHPVVISVLKGAFYFLADLTRHITEPIHIDFMAIGVYSGVTANTGVVKITKDLDISITHRHVLLVEDIVGTGLTLGYIYQHLEALKPASLHICTLLDNPALRLVNVPVTYCGFTAPEGLLVGYGLDHQEEYRHLPYIGMIQNDSSSHP